MSRVILPALVILLVLTACSPAALPPTATATYTATRPAPTATVTPTETPDWLPEGLREVQERLAPGGFELVAGEDAGVYEVMGADGQKVEGVKVYEDGATELTMMVDGKEKTLVTGVGAVTSHEGKLVWGLRSLEDGQWSAPHGKTAAEAAAGFEADYPYSLEIDMGSDKKDQMIATMFAEHERAMSKTETYDPASEFEGITVTTNRGTKYEKTYTYDEILPKKWYFINSAVIVLPRNICFVRANLVEIVPPGYAKCHAVVWLDRADHTTLGGTGRSAVRWSFWLRLEAAL